MLIKGLDKSSIKHTKMTIEEIGQNISEMLNKNIKTITIISVGWDAFFGNYAVVRAGGNKLWIVSDGEIIENNGWIKERNL